MTIAVQLCRIGVILGISLRHFGWVIGAVDGTVVVRGAAVVVGFCGVWRMASLVGLGFIAAKSM